jgi:hypothetical protein
VRTAYGAFMKHPSFLAVIACTALALPACKEQKSTSPAVKSTDKSAAAVADSAQKTGEAAGETTRKAGEAAGDAVKKSGG